MFFEKQYVKPSCMLEWIGNDNEQKTKKKQKLIEWEL